jgi:3-oxoacyl-[acyl-carrier protein] reductase
MHEDLKGKTALVTGSGKTTGIGYAIAETLAAAGCNVIIADLGRQDDSVAVKMGSTEEMDKIASDLAATYGVKTLAVPVDVTDPEAIAAMVETVQGTFEHLDILCNNAGASFGVPNLFQTYDEDAWMKTIDVNLHSVFRISRALIPLMVGTPGAIVNTASRAGKVPPIFNGAYAVAKAGVIMLTKVMAKELAPMNIRVNAICPGQIMTDLERWRFQLEADSLGGTPEERKAEMCTTIPLNRIGEPKEVGNLVAFLVSEASSYMTGQALNITGGQLMEL